MRPGAQQTYCMVGEEMVNIMTALPPSYGETATEVCNEDAY